MYVYKKWFQGSTFQLPRGSQNKLKIVWNVPCCKCDSTGSGGIVAKVWSLSEWCFIISVGVSSDHSQLRRTGFAGSQ